MKHPRIFSCALVLFAATSLHLDASSLLWTNRAGGNWSAPINWDPNQVPADADTVFITNSGTYTVTLDSHVSVGELVIGGGSGEQSVSINGYNVTLTGQGLVRNHGQITFEGGVLSGAWTIASGGTLNLTGSGNLKELYTGVLTNAGRINYSGDRFRLNSSARFYNLAGGVFDIQADNRLSWYYGNESFQNAGLVRKSGGTGTTIIDPPLDNLGTVEVQSGTLSLISGGSLGGVFTAGVGTEIVFVNGPLYYRDGVIWDGAGVRRLNGATLHCEGLTSPVDLWALTLSAGNVMADGVVSNLTLQGANFYGNDATMAGISSLVSGAISGTNRLTGVLNWEGGTVVGALTVASGGTLNLTGSGNLKELY
ncbi:MAG: hypothetical protein WCQ21_36915, partial [Verrucomicrobiota bacterium]